MRAMKDSGIGWIGQVPESWESRSLKFALDAHSGGAWGSNEGGDETDTICVRVADFDYAKLSVDFHDKMTVRSYTEKAIAESSLKHGDILLEKSGGGEVTPVGRSVLFAGEEGMMCANFIEWLRPNQYFNSYFLNYWLAAAYINGFSKRNVKQTTGIQNLDIPAFLSEKIVAPNVIEQKQIAQYLDIKCAEIDALIGAKEKTNALLKERRQSIIYEAVTKGLNPDAPMKDSGIEWIGQIPENWDLLRLRFLGAFQNGISKAGEFFGSGYPFVSYGDVYKNEVLPTVPSGLVESTESERELYSVEKGDVFFTRTSETKEEIGIVAVCKETIPDATFAGFLIRMRPTTEVVTTDFLRYYFSCGLQREYFSKEMTLVTRASLGQDLLKNMVVTIPSAEEQEAIVNYLDEQTQAIDSIISNNDVSIRKLKEYRQSIIYEAVTGKIEI